jgi:hypothetical protein
MGGRRRLGLSRTRGRWLDVERVLLEFCLLQSRFRESGRRRQTKRCVDGRRSWAIYILVKNVQVRKPTHHITGLAQICLQLPNFFFRGN